MTIDRHQMTDYLADIIILPDLNSIGHKICHHIILKVVL